MLLNGQGRISFCSPPRRETVFRGYASIPSSHQVPSGALPQSRSPGLLVMVPDANGAHSRWTGGVDVRTSYFSSGVILYCRAPARTRARSSPSFSFSFHRGYNPSPPSRPIIATNAINHAHRRWVIIGIRSWPSHFCYNGPHSLDACQLLFVHSRPEVTHVSLGRPGFLGRRLSGRTREICRCKHRSTVT